MYKKIWGVGLLLVTLLSFSGLAAAATISNTGSNVVYHGSEKFTNNWYISTTSASSSTLVFKSKEQIKISDVWHSLPNYQLNTNYLKISSTKIKMTMKGYMGSKVISSSITFLPAYYTPYHYAKSMEPSIIKRFA